MKRIALLIAPLVLAACIPDPYSMKPEVKVDPDKISDAAEPIVVVDPKSGANVRAVTGQLIRIELDANPTTGIWWQDPEFDESVVKLISNDYLADPAPEGIVGSGGKTVMTFETLASGKTKIKSDYSRGGGEVYERLSITVKVSE